MKLSKNQISISRAVFVVSMVCMLATGFAFAQQPTPAPTSAVKVFLAATGTSDQLPAVLDGISDYLSDKGVSSKQLSSQPESRSTALDKLNQKGGAYLLFIVLDFAPGKNIRSGLTIQCFDTTGKSLWKEEVKGGMFMANQSSYINGMIKNVCKKLDSHLGQAGLPKDSPK